MSEVVNATPTGASESSSQPTESAATPSAEPKAASTAPVKEKIKVDGAEEEWTPEELKKWAQIGRAKEKRFEESAKMRKEAESQLERLKTKPWEVLKELGLDTRKAAEEYLGNILEDEMLTPEQKAQRDKDRKLADYEKKEKEELSRKEQEAHEKAKSEYLSQLDQELDTALQNSPLPKNAGVIRRVATYLDRALDADLDMTVEEAVALVEQDYADEVSQFFGSTKDPSKYLPKDLAKKLMDSHLAQVKAAPKYSQAEAAPQSSEKAQQRLSPADFMKEIMGQKR